MCTSKHRKRVFLIFEREEVVEVHADRKNTMRCLSCLHGVRSGQVPCFVGNSKLCKRPSKGGSGEVRSFIGVSWLCKRASKHKNAKRKQNHLFRGGFAFFLHFGQFSSCRIRQRGAGCGVITFALPNNEGDCA